MNSVFILEHVRVDGEREDIKLIGAFSTKETAEAAINKLSTLPGFRDYPDGFSNEQYELDQIHWQEGFVVVKC